MKTLLSGIAASVKSFFKAAPRRAYVAGTDGIYAPNDCRDHWDSLLSKCLGDRRHAERLIHFEFQRDAAISRSAAVRRANERWERDMSR